MPIQLTPEQEQRLTAVVSAGAYTSTEDALNAALTVVEKTAAHGFEVSMEDLEQLLLEGINSGQPTLVDEAFWQRLTVQTDQLLEEHQGRPGLSGCGSRRFCGDDNRLLDGAGGSRL